MNGNQNQTKMSKFAFVSSFLFEFPFSHRLHKVRTELDWHWTKRGDYKSSVPPERSSDPYWNNIGFDAVTYFLR